MNPNSDRNLSESGFSGLIDEQDYLSLIKSENLKIQRIQIQTVICLNQDFPD